MSTDSGVKPTGLGPGSGAHVNTWSSVAPNFGTAHDTHSAIVACHEFDSFGHEIADWVPVTNCPTPMIVPAPVAVSDDCDANPTPVPDGSPTMFNDVPDAGAVPAPYFDT